MEDLSACYGVIVNDYELRQTLIRGAERSPAPSRPSVTAGMRAMFSFLRSVRLWRTSVARKPEPLRSVSID
jgi:hypothetical protein